MSVIAQRDYRRDKWDHFWKDKNGHVVVYQHPNFLLIGWVVLTLISLFLNGRTADILYYVGLGVLAIWALLEVLKGVNYFRRTLGAVVLVMIILAVIKVGI